MFSQCRVSINHSSDNCCPLKNIQSNVVLLYSNIDIRSFLWFSTWMVRPPPPHWWINVKYRLNSHFLVACELAVTVAYRGHSGPRDITSLDFLMRGCIKDTVYSKKVKDLVELKQRVREAVASVTADRIHNAWRRSHQKTWHCGS